MCTVAMSTGLMREREKRNSTTTVIKASLNSFSPPPPMGADRFDIRLMQSGRMKGQAFVGLATEAAATAAVTETNGYCLAGKPMVVVSQPLLLTRPSSSPSLSLSLSSILPEQPKPSQVRWPAHNNTSKPLTVSHSSHNVSISRFTFTTEWRLMLVHASSMKLNINFQ